MPIRYRPVPPDLTNGQLDALFRASWPGHQARNFAPVLARSLTYVCAFDGDRLVGFVNVAWDGGLHAFLLDTTVHPDHRRQGVGTELVRRAAKAAGDAGAAWLHVDFEPHLASFYVGCGFRDTAAGVMRLG